ncbi:MAG TPA: M1 family metallopeptidase [Gemmatimonadaceae bacterium]|nr:M1 family metallopeptidase [Gemmatimonadaceae bacterium]
MLEHSSSRHSYGLTLIASLLAAFSFSTASAAQTRPAPAANPAATADGGRPIPGPIYEIPDFSTAVERGTRTRSGRPGTNNWVQHARYRIDARLDAANARLEGRESVVYLNNSPDTLGSVAVHLRQNVFAPGSPRRSAVPITGGVKLGRVAVAGKPMRSAESRRALGSMSGGGYTVDGAVMWIRLPAPLLPHDSTRLEIAWSFTPAPSPSDGREGREGHHLYFLGYWYPQVAVYDDVHGWVADPYLNGAEFYMDPADYDVRITVPHGWPVGATGTLENADSVLSRQSLDRLARARATREVVHVLTAADRASGAGFARGGKESTWHFVANDVRDFAWGTSDRYNWDATIALVPGANSGATDTVMISSFFRIHPSAAAWPLGGARFTRDAIEKMSEYLWPYPWPQMTSMEGVITGGGMEYPMMTLMQPWADTLSLAGDLMHETGHMWFPMQVGSNETRYPWMDEGLTQFDVAQGMRTIYGEPRKGGRPNDSEPGQRRLYVQQARAGHEMALMTLGELSDQDLYFIMYYDKTAQVLSALRAVLGEESFHRAYREYGKRWIGRHPYPADFFNTMSDVSGRDLSWFWRSWFYEPWSLDQAIASVREEGDSVAITVEDRGLAPMPVVLAVTREGGKVQRVEAPVDVWLSGARKWTAKVSAAPRIVSVEIDPDQGFPDIDRDNQRWKR